MDNLHTLQNMILSANALAAAFDLVDPEAAADDENLFSLHLRATEAADNLQKIAESLQK